MERFGIGYVPQIFLKQLLKLFTIAALELQTFSVNYLIERVREMLFTDPSNIENKRY